MDEPERDEREEHEAGTDGEPGTDGAAVLPAREAMSLIAPLAPPGLLPGPAEIDASEPEEENLSPEDRREQITDQDRAISDR